ncbi:hypothetical protein LTR10_011481 [Elasticomyces elasticus]|uniref:Ubiquitinyl hydrolase 1 n=1 Tax=Exophiala sideris TaxID=1016849 RepID=A0ABR0JCL8_9EURO|nr:hypothetical protein LTR10_011481 [Elasticomyces elasticus]KAK5032063.1 hypothetical protein LTS07_004685 [Exophiala sideris]KAK5040991.1 hypothetical protein LTR13_003293 [Exophiala sideris]KAK5061675.1 hypothetical protein LTR69_004857 [Exophiala sideris]KAK5184375.1 hypothetical protein LTR44_003048 [Eurotiomycetes sp. CCFEE 6388]
MRAVGIDYDIIIDMFDYTWELFDAIKSAIEHGTKNEAVLLECMNDQGRSDSIVYHFKMMTSAFMRLHSDRYEAFLEMPVASYCESRIDPANQEIDHIGLQALTDAVIAPAYIGLEVSYLDRSTGDEVTPHPFVLNSQGWPTIRLIYRPGHYDIIYKDDGPIQVLLQTGAPQYVIPFHDDVFRGDEDAVNMHSFMFPNANILPSQTLPGSAPSTSMNSYPPMFQNPQPAMFDAQVPAMQNSYFPPMTQMNSQQAPQPQHQSPAPPVRSLSMPHLGHSFSLAPSLPATSPSTLSPSTPILLTPSSPNVHKPHEYQIRYNQNCYQYTARRQQSLPLDRGSFGSSALSPAHFANADFQPQLWNAEEEYGKRD